MAKTTRAPAQDKAAASAAAPKPEDQAAAEAAAAEAKAAEEAAAAEAAAAEAKAAEEAAAAEAAAAEAKAAEEAAAAEAAKEAERQLPRQVVAPIYSVRTAGQATRRRSGLSFGPEAIEIDSEALSPRELDALLTDPHLICTQV